MITIVRARLEVAEYLKDKWTFNVGEMLDLPVQGGFIVEDLEEVENKRTGPTGTCFPVGPFFF